METAVYGNLNEAADLKLALDILESFKCNQPENLTLLSSGHIDDDTDSIEIVFPEWLIVLSDAFKRIYGMDKSPYALTHVLKILLSRWVGERRLTTETAEIYMALVNSCFHSAPSATRH